MTIECRNGESTEVDLAQPVVRPRTLPSWWNCMIGRRGMVCVRWGLGAVWLGSLIHSDMVGMRGKMALSSRRTDWMFSMDRSKADEHWTGKKWSCKQSKADGLVLRCSILLQVIQEVLLQMISNGILLGVCLNWGRCGLLIFSFCFLFVVVPCWFVFAL